MATKEEIKQKLIADPDFLISFIIQNNPMAIYQNLARFGYFTPYDNQAMFEKIRLLFQIGQGPVAEQILKVPFLEENAPEGYAEIIDEINSLNQ